MAYETGVASDYIDLWDKLVSFLTTNVDLVAAGEEWDVVWTHPGGQPSGVTLRGPGTTGADTVYVSMAATRSPDSDINRISFRGASGLIPSATGISGHVNVSPETRIWLDRNPMKYWFIANGRRFAVVVNMSAVYQSAYCGLFLPYSNPTSYPYPLYIGGSSSAWSGSNSANQWRDQTYLHASFPFAQYNSEAGATGDTRSNAWMLDQSGSWLAVCSDSSTTPSHSPRDGGTSYGLLGNVWSIEASTSVMDDRLGHNTIRQRITQNYGGGFTLDRVSLTATSPTPRTYGVLDGIYFCPGVGNAAENVVQIGGVDHLVVQNVFRTTTGNYWALALE